MIDKSILKPIRFFEELSDLMLESISSISELRIYSSNTYLNRRRRSADYLYVILEGEVVLEIESLTGNIVPIETIGAGEVIGISSLIEPEKSEYLSDAKTLVPTKALRIRSDQLFVLFYQNFELGFLIMKKIAYITRLRLTQRTHPIPKI
ncbi:hypothetical protein DSCW_53090 [Desulfosarcina widdelii]|uniref:Cyclic nucleotide-binding domain-containing protein n=1 Tax=Desulfosarcina widdelii TaxID=947919 RepID=A0A5K7Z7A5_9BACT|nr:Crp/Fnr family transcriptional regulator [Desulfosarcina widdelii]BBO77892.1 hypothetical protein DSCW_53090 [Desulfosarcina widdelii]